MKTKISKMSSKILIQGFNLQVKYLKLNNLIFIIIILKIYIKNIKKIKYR